MFKNINLFSWRIMINFEIQNRSQRNSYAFVPLKVKMNKCLSKIRKMRATGAPPITQKLWQPFGWGKGIEVHAGRSRAIALY